MFYFANSSILMIFFSRFAYYIGLLCSFGGADVGESAFDRRSVARITLTEQPS